MFASTGGECCWPRIRADRQVSRDRDRLPHLTCAIYVDPRGLWHYQQPQLKSFADLQAAPTGPNGAADPNWLDWEIDIGKADDIAALCYTSGTTGLPKGAMLSHRFLLDNAYRVMAAHRVRAHAEYLSYISPAWATEQIMGFALGVLAPLVVNFSEKPDTVKRDLREVGPEYLLFTPRQWEMLASDVQAQMLDAGKLRQKLYAGRSTPVEPRARPCHVRRRVMLPIASIWFCPVRYHLVCCAMRAERPVRPSPRCSAFHASSCRSARYSRPSAASCPRIDGRRSGDLRTAAQRPTRARRSKPGRP